MTLPGQPCYNTTAENNAAFLAASAAARAPEDNPMVIVKGPLLSQDATGKLGNDLQVSHWKGRNVLGRRRRPSQPRTEPQQAHRILMGFLSTQWKTFTPAQRVTWEAPATEDRTPPYNAFIKRNMARYRDVHKNYLDARLCNAFPTAAYPAARETLPASFNVFTITGLQLAVRFDWNVTDIRQNWGMCIHHAWYPNDPHDFTDLVAMIRLTDAGPGSLTIAGLKPGLYQTLMQRFTFDAQPVQYWVKRQAVVSPPASPPPHPGPPQPPPPPPIPF